MDERPRIKLELNSVDISIELLGWTSVVIIWVLIITNYRNLPETISIHYNGAGQADRYSQKENILALPLDRKSTRLNSSHRT